MSAIDIADMKPNNIIVFYAVSAIFQPCFIAPDRF